MNNWYLKFIAFGFLALAVGLGATWLSSFFFWKPGIQKGIGFLAAGLAVIVADLVLRKTIDTDGIYQEVFLLPFIPIRIPAWVFGVVIAIGGVVVLCSGD